MLNLEIRLIQEDYPDDPYRNLAMDEAIFMEVGSRRSPPTLRFYQNRNAVILGCFQSAEQEVDLGYAKANSIIIAKRLTGGGAVYHDMGDLNYSIISPDVFDIGLNAEKLFKLMMGGAKKSLEHAGIPSPTIGMNDVSSNGKKIMGAAATMKKGTVLFHAAMLVNSDLNKLATVLKVPGIKLKDKGVQTILERVTNISQISNATTESLKSSILNGYRSELGFNYKGGSLTENERKLTQRLCEQKYLKDEWNLGTKFIEIQE